LAGEELAGEVDGVLLVATAVNRHDSACGFHQRLEHPLLSIEFAVVLDQSLLQLTDCFVVLVDL
jgi:hypothetical protein